MAKSFPELTAESLKCKVRLRFITKYWHFTNQAFSLQHIFFSTFVLMKEIWDQILRYFFLKKKDPDAPKTTYVKMMHGMNRISILLFFVCVIILLVRLFKHLFG